MASARPGRLPLDDRPGALRREVPRREAGAAGGHDEAGELVDQLVEGVGHAARAVGDGPVLDDVEALGPEPFDQRRARPVVAGARHDAVGDGQDLGREPRGWLRLVGHG